MIRSVDATTLSQLKALAQANERSLESECRYALRHWALERESNLQPVGPALIEMALTTHNVASVLQSAIDTLADTKLKSGDGYRLVLQVMAVAVINDGELMLSPVLIKRSAYDSAPSAQGD